MATMFQQYADGLYDSYELADADNETGKYYNDTAMNDWLSFDTRACLFHIMDAIDGVQAAVTQVISRYSTTGSEYRLYRCLKLSWEYTIKDPPEGLTMDSLLSVMVAATDSELMNFIGLVDAYRQSLWNKEFNAEYFAALARGFK